MAQEMELRSSDYDELVTLIAGAAVTKGTFVLVGGVYGFYLHDAAVGAYATVITKGSKVYVVKEAALAIAAGDVVYFDTTAREADKTGTNVLVGHCVRAAAAADTHVLISFDGMAAFLKA